MKLEEENSVSQYQLIIDKHDSLSKMTKIAKSHKKEPQVLRTYTGN